MRILATSDIHTHYAKNKNWLIGLSDADYQQDILILAGDITHDLEELRKAFEIVRPKFAEVLFVPGNHDLWLSPKDQGLNSIDKFHRIMEFAIEQGIHTKPLHFDTFSIAPLFSWYDYSFGKPSEFIIQKWQDFRFCKWPENHDMVRVTDYFLSS